MRPRIYQIDQEAGGITRAELHEKAIAFVEERYPRTGDVPFLWIIDDGQKLVWLETPWENEAEKVASYNAVAVILEVSRAKQYVSITEVWIASQTRDASGKYPDDAPLPSERPENERDDAILIITYERSGAFDLSHFICKPKSKLLGVRVDEGGPGGIGHWQGRMFDLFSRGPQVVSRLLKEGLNK